MSLIPAIFPHTTPETTLLYIAKKYANYEPDSFNINPKKPPGIFILLNHLIPPLTTITARTSF